MIERQVDVCGRMFTITAQPVGDGPGSAWLATVREGADQKLAGIPIGVDLDTMSDKQRDEILSGVEGVIEAHCRRGAI